MNRPNPATHHRLSRRQKDILATIRELILERGYSPSIREIGDAVGLSSSSTVHSHLRALEIKGFIKRKPGTVRAITLVDTPAPVPILERVQRLEALVREAREFIPDGVHHLSTPEREQQGRVWHEMAAVVVPVEELATADA